MKELVLVPEGGLCNRICAITSAVAFAKKYDLQLTVYWFKDWGMGANFHDLFTLSQTVENVVIKDANFADLFKYAKPRKGNLFLPRWYQKLKFDATYFWYEEKFYDKAPKMNEDGAYEYEEKQTVEEWYSKRCNRLNINELHPPPEKNLQTP